MKFTLFFIPLAAAGLLPRTLPGCTCDEIMCIQSMPNSCECFNEVQTACKIKCGPKLSFPLRDCKALETGDEQTGDDNNAAAGFGILPVETTNLPPVVAREPILPVIPTSLPAVETKKPAETCECEEVFCIASIPGSCECKMQAAEACSLKCKTTPPKQADVCSPYEISIAPRSPVLPVIPTALPAVEPKKKAPEPCQCEEVFCAMDFPGSCYCENAGIQACAKKCGGEPKGLKKCPPMPNKTLIQRVAAPTAA